MRERDVKAGESRREEILNAAFEQFSSYGFRRTSMEDIAQRTGVSRASLYLHFKNKEEIFRSLSEVMHEQALAGVEAALKRDAPAEERVRLAVEAKVVGFLEIVRDSPHGAELMDESSRLCGEVAARTEERLQKLLTQAFRSAARDGEIDLQAASLSAPAAADLFRLSAYGFKQAGLDPEVFRRRLSDFSRVFFAGLAS
jgi:TetR/AcrR family transcriptional repressor of mexJK operon